MRDKDSSETMKNGVVGAERKCKVLIFAEICNKFKTDRVCSENQFSANNIFNSMDLLLCSWFLVALLHAKMIIQTEMIFYTKILALRTTIFVT